MDIRPDYPQEAKAKGLTGAGVFVLHLDPKSGVVRSVSIKKSTGHKILDDAAVTKFRNLRFHPNTVSTVTIPLEFVLPGALARTSGVPAATTVTSGQPMLSARVRGPGKQ